MHYLIAGTCLGLAVKMNENCILDFEQIIELCSKESGFEYSNEMFLQAEFQIFKQFDFDLNIPTAIELLLQVLFLEVPENQTALKQVTNE